MEQTLEQKRLAVLEDTISYFNLSTRNTNKHGTCKYLSKHTKTQGCAIGRLIADKELCEELDNLGEIVCGVGHDNVFNRLPSNLKELGKPFLLELQLLHDNPYFWNDIGLSVEGILKANNIKNIFTK